MHVGTNITKPNTYFFYNKQTINSINNFLYFVLNGNLGICLYWKANIKKQNYWFCPKQISEPQLSLRSFFVVPKYLSVFFHTRCHFLARYFLINKRKNNLIVRQFETNALKERRVLRNLLLHQEHCSASNKK